MQFCSKKQINPFKANINNVLSFLTDLFKSGLGYSSINTARCALSSYFSLDNSVNISSNVLVKRFMKGVYTLRPALPRYNVTWDVNVVLKYLKGLSPLESLSLLQISQKLLMLLLLLSGQRGQTFHLMDIKNIFITEDNVKIVIGDLLKNSKPGKQLGELNFPAFTDKDLCIVNMLIFYLEKTKTLRGNITQLFITTQKPYKAVTRDTICRWTRTVLIKSGIDVNIFKPHSTRAASTTAANVRNVPMSTILKTAGWKKDCMFRKFYKKPIVMDKSYSENLLNAFA